MITSCIESEIFGAIRQWFGVFLFSFFCCCFWALTPVANIPQDFAIKRFCGIGPSQEWGCFFLSCRLLRNSFELKKKKWFNSFWVVCDGTMKLFFNSLRSSLAVNALYACVHIYIRQLSSFRVATLWFIDLTVATCHIQYTYLSLCWFCWRENGQNTRILGLPLSSLSYGKKMAADGRRALTVRELSSWCLL